MMIKSVVLLLSLLVGAHAFVPGSAKVDSAVALKMGYVPDGMSPEQYRKLREKEKAAEDKKKYGAFGPQSFQSRSLQAFQTDMEAGKAGHLMPVLDAKEKLRKGLIKKDDIPYMQRLGSWDNSDLGKKKEWTEVDKRYRQDKVPDRVDWMGAGPRKGPPRPSTNAKKPPPAATTTDNKKKNGFFGLF